MSRAIERIWAADGPAAWALTPLSWLFGLATGTRNLLFDLGVLRAHDLGLPAVSVGNISVGGTGKTPVSAWVAAQLVGMGARPAILLRGYGGDEPLVHARLNPGVPVIANADRVAGAAEAKAQGATVLVLDDAFQHRRAARDLDLVLVAAEQGEAHRLLPAGPLREGRRALRRAQLVIVTRKSSSMAEAERVAAGWTGFAGAPPTAVLSLTPGPLRPLEPSGASLPLVTVAGKRVLAVSAIGAPAAFEAQLRAAGAVVESAAYPDHHAFSAADVAALVQRATATDLTVCTLKDAVKLGPQWPRQATGVWYLSQAVEVERGGASLREALHRLVPEFQP
jgi:tetraacyldisaccharide 4'-kinase